MIMSWLWNSMLPEISSTCTFSSTAKEVWEAIKQTYSKVRDAAQVFECKTKISATKQGEKPVTEYAILLKNLWQEMDHYQCLEMKCSEDAALLKKVQILGKDDLPSLNETISMVRAEEGRRGVMMNETPAIESSALLSNVGNMKKAMTEKQSHGDNGRADLSKTATNESIWRTIQQKGGHANFTSSNQCGMHEQGEFNREDFDGLKNLVESFGKSSGACSLALSVEDKDKDRSCLLDLSSTYFPSYPSPITPNTTPTVENTTPTAENTTPSPITPNTVESTPSSSSTRSLTKEKSVHNSTRPLQVYSRKKAIINEPVQVQELEPVPESGNERRDRKEEKKPERETAVVVAVVAETVACLAKVAPLSVAEPRFVTKPHSITVLLAVAQPSPSPSPHLWPSRTSGRRTHLTVAHLWSQVW
ncbi:hypothetical protein EZV62_015184 [Acer yangbiense]|uniref:Retrotransposon gag domain-containing protein n=1 Tax=Acer yangbiense TaxID=1000413 RepID=A0A5C7HU63_9ROSI|nr:hypothetical protein EZV62_015184 [Acer yangbiense]